MSERPDFIPDDWLPPREYWLVDLRDPRNKVETPQIRDDPDEIVDKFRLIEIIKGMVSPDYAYPGRTSVHHLQWEANRYSREPMPHTGVKPAVFRNLPPHKVRIPRVFENIIHQITFEPPVPSEEVMYYRTKAYGEASVLYNSMSKRTLWSRRTRRRRELIAADPSILSPEFNGQDVEGEATLENILYHNYRGVNMHTRIAASIPPEFQIVSPYDTPERIARSIGPMVRRQHVVLTKAVRTAAA